MRRWHNVYELEISHGHVCAKHAASFGTQWLEDFLRVEERWNGHRLLPPVGMQSAQASHRWSDCHFASEILKVLERTNVHD